MVTRRSGADDHLLLSLNERYYQGFYPSKRSGTIAGMPDTGLPDQKTGGPDPVQVKSGSGT
jgi:hypothetical protein